MPLGLLATDSHGSCHTPIEARQDSHQLFGLHPGAQTVVRRGREGSGHTDAWPPCGRALDGQRPLETIQQLVNGDLVARSRGEGRHVQARASPSPVAIGREGSGIHRWWARDAPGLPKLQEVAFRARGSPAARSQGKPGAAGRVPHQGTPRSAGPPARRLDPPPADAPPRVGPSGASPAHRGVPSRDGVGRRSSPPRRHRDAQS